MTRLTRIWFLCFAAYSLGMCLWFLLTGCSARRQTEPSANIRAVSRATIHSYGRLALVWDEGRTNYPPAICWVYSKTNLADRWTVVSNTWQAYFGPIDPLDGARFFTVTASNRFGEVPTIRKAGQ